MVAAGFIEMVRCRHRIQNPDLDSLYSANTIRNSPSQVIENRTRRSREARSKSILNSDRDNAMWACSYSKRQGPALEEWSSTPGTDCISDARETSRTDRRHGHA